MKDELIGYDAIGLGELTRKGEIRPIELLDITIQRIEALNPKLNAVIHKMYDQARETAAYWDSEIRAGNAGDVLFCGVPFLLKDLIGEYKGAPFHEGCLAVKGYVSKIDSELVKRQKAGGLVIVGKTNTPEFGCLPTTEPALYGPTRQPLGPETDAGWVERRVGSGCDRGDRSHGSWQRWGRFNPYPGLLLWAFWFETNSCAEPSGTAVRRYWKWDRS